MNFRRTPIFGSTFLLVLVSLAAEVPLQPLQQLAQPIKDLPPPPAAVTNAPAWKSSVTLGLTMARGNKDTMLVTAKLQTQWRSAFNEFTIGLDGAYGEDNSVKNYERLHGFGQFNHFFTRRFYGYVRADGLHDGIKNIDYRFTVSPGVGYYLIQQTNLTLATEVGPSMVVERQGKKEETYAALRLAERLEYKLTPTTRLWQAVEFIPEVDKTENYVVNAELGIEVGITRDFGLQAYFQDSFVSQPAAGFKNNDLRLVCGVSYKF